MTDTLPPASTIPSSTQPTDAHRAEDVTESRFRKVAIWILLGLMLIICISVFFAFVKYGKTEELWIPIAKAHFAAIVGLPMAALASLCIVLILRISSGPVEFEAWGLKFKGAAAPIVFWILCFLVIAVCIKMLW
jgi:hypothetical protein